MPVHEKSPQNKFRPDVSLHPAGINYYSNLSNDFTLKIKRNTLFMTRKRDIFCLRHPKAIFYLTNTK